MSSGTSHKRAFEPNPFDLEDIQLSSNWEDVTCPVCLDSPHNGVLLLCSSFKKGCRPFICDTDKSHSNCFERFKIAHGVPEAAKVVPELAETSCEDSQAVAFNTCSCPICPLCRGEVIGWIVIDEARQYLDMKRRCCEEKRCSYVGNFSELQDHAKQEHPHARPSEIDPAQQQDWDNLQQSSEIVDVLSTIHSEVPNGVVLGDYVIEYGNDSGDEFDDFPGDEGNWWTSCILYHVFDNFRASRSRRRSRASDTNRRQRSSSYRPSVDGGPTFPLDILDSNFDENADEFGEVASSSGAAARSHERRSYRRRRSHFHDP